MTDTDTVKVAIHENGSKTNKYDTHKELCLAYPLGAKILVNELHFEIGGGGTNTAVSFSRLGLKTGYLGKIGRDNSGIQIFNLLHREKIEFLGNFGEKAGYSVILDSQNSDRTILTYKGCNDDFKFKEINKKNLKTKWFYFSSMTKNSLKALVELSKFAKTNKIKVAFNPSGYLLLEGISHLKQILENTDILVLNLQEAKILSSKEEINDMLVHLKKQTKLYVVITDGKNGCWCYDGNKILHAEPLKNIKIVETTGAGDAFASAFTAGIMQNISVEKSLKMGMIQSESVIKYRGAKNILLSKKKMEELLKKDKRKIKQIKIKRQIQVRKKY